jgi:nucleoid-associated protein YgaU
MPESSSEPVDIALTVAKERLEWATGIDAKTQFPVLYTQAVTAYTTAVKEKNTKNWNTAMTSAQATIAAVTEIEKLYEALKADEAYTALATAKVWMDWATGIGAKTKFPVLYTKAMSTYTSAVKAQGIKNWNSALLNAQATVVTVGEIEKLHEALKAKDRDAVTVTPEASPKSKAHLHSVSFTSTYTVKSGDCYWSIAHQFYGDAQKWRLIYDANKRGMRNPDNPHAIFPGMVLTIPGITER